jgi:hypothetical protein
MGEKGSHLTKVLSVGSSTGARGNKGGGASGVAGQRCVERAVRPQPVLLLFSSGSSSSEEYACAMTWRSSLVKLLPSSSAMESILPLPMRHGLWGSVSASSTTRGASDLWGSMSEKVVN